MNIQHLVKIRFDRRGPHAIQEWFDERLLFFRDHTFESLLRQTSKTWKLWVNYDDSETMRMVKLSMERVVGSRGSWPLLGLRVVESVGDEPCGIGGTDDYVYVTRLDSDDLLAPDALEIVHRTRPRSYGDVETSIFCRGYIHDLVRGRTGVYVNPSSPFHTLMFPRAVFCDPTKYGVVWHRVGDHSMVRSSGIPYQVLPDFKFTVLIHGNNFLSDFDYRRDRTEPTDPTWTMDKFFDPPVVFDVDDLCDRHAGVLDDLKELKNVYPGFRCTLFTIPDKTSPGLLLRVARMNAVPREKWIELAMHGVRHEPNEELKVIGPEYLSDRARELDSVYERGFRPPGWFIEDGHARVLSDLGYWVAIHERDRNRVGPFCRAGYYACGDRWPYWHGHAHDVCGNWVHGHLRDGDRLLTKWPTKQRFGWISEAILKPI